MPGQDALWRHWMLEHQSLGHEHIILGPKAFRKCQNMKNNNWLVVLIILKHIWKSMERIIPYIMENKTCLKPPTRQPLKKTSAPRVYMQNGNATWNIYDPPNLKKQLHMHLVDLPWFSISRLISKWRLHEMYSNVLLGFTWFHGPRWVWYSTLDLQSSSYFIYPTIYTWLVENSSGSREVKWTSSFQAARVIPRVLLLHYQEVCCPRLFEVWDQWTELPDVSVDAAPWNMEYLAAP